MALIPEDKYIDTILQMIERHRPIYETVIDRYFSGRRLNLFVGRRATIPTSSLPSIEVVNTGNSLSWFAVRVQQEQPTLELDITTDNNDPEQAVRLESALVCITTRILAAPVNLRPYIARSQHWMYDAFPGNVRYGSAGEGRMRVAVVSWSGQTLEYLTKKITSHLGFEPDIDFPPN